MPAQKKQTDVTGSGYSDDCVSFEPLKTKDSEYDAPDKWYTLRLGGDPVGRIRMVYDGGAWDVEINGLESPFSLTDDVPVTEQPESVQERQRRREEDR